MQRAISIRTEIPGGKTEQEDGTSESTGEELSSFAVQSRMDRSLPKELGEEKRKRK